MGLAFFDMVRLIGMRKAWRLRLTITGEEIGSKTFVFLISLIQNGLVGLIRYTSPQTGHQLKTLCNHAKVKIVNYALDNGLSDSSYELAQSLCD